MPPRFVARLTELLPVSVAMLLVAMEFDQQQMHGPPFALDIALAGFTNQRLTV